MVSARLRGPNLIRVGVASLLLLVLVGIMGMYATIDNNAARWVSSPSALRSEDEVGFLSIAQLSPVLNAMSEEGLFVPGIITWRASKVRASLIAHDGDKDNSIAAPYDLKFLGEYQLTLPDSRLNAVEVIFPFPQNLETLHDVQFLVDGKEPANVEYSTSGIRWQDQFISNEEHTISISYKAEGAYTFTYELPKEQRTDVDVEITVDGLTGTSVPESSLPPIDIESDSEGETISWEYAGLIDNRNIQILLPIEPSFSQRITEIQIELSDLAGFAPIIVAATLVALAITLHLGNTRLKLETYLLLGLGLVLFFPLITFLGGLIGIPAGSFIALLLTIGLLVVFLNQTVGWGQIGWQTVLVLFVFLGFFGLGRLTQWSGLFLTTGGVLLLGVFMVLYARWQKGRDVVEEIQTPEKPEEIALPMPEADLPSQPVLHCPQCSQSLEDDVNFCPTCGYETKQIKHCESCGREHYPPPDFDVVFCLGCGEALS